MYVMGMMVAGSRKRDAFLAIVLEGTTQMPGRLSYIVTADPNDSDALWIR